MAHHIIHWANLGPTDLDNLVLLCPSCHHLVHEGGHTIHRRPDGTFTVIGPNRTQRRHTTERCASEQQAGDGPCASEHGASESSDKTPDGASAGGGSNRRATATRERPFFDPSDIPPDIRGGPFDPNATNPYDPNDPNNPDNRDNDDPDDAKKPPPRAREDETNNPADLDTHPPAPRAPNRPRRSRTAEEAIAQARQAIKHSQENSQPNAPEDDAFGNVA